MNGGKNKMTLNGKRSTIKNYIKIIYYRFKFKCYKFLYHLIMKFCKFLRKILIKAFDKAEEIFEKEDFVYGSLLEAIADRADTIEYGNNKDEKTT